MLATNATPERIDPRVKRTRNLILRAFNELLAERGFEAITVQDIAERAEINRATFYAHFADKYALLDYSIRQAFRQELEKRTLSACHYSPQNLSALIVTVCEFIAQANQHCKNSSGTFESLIENQIRQQIRELLDLWLTQVETKIDRDIAATATSWVIYGLAQDWSLRKPRPPVESYAEQIRPLVERNLGMK
jgi:AcrR family transcriptional regulator